jgi:hypothetical protein
MHSTPPSASRIIRMTLALCAAFSAILAAIYFYRPAQDLVQELTRPVTVRPQIYGSVVFYGKPVAGVELRIGGKVRNKGQACTSLPVVAVSDEAGKFEVPAKTKPRFLVSESKLIPAEMCVMRGTERLASWLSFFIPNNTLAKVIHCQLPIIGPIGPENDTCYITAP